jgi:hypothetical protein
MAANMLIFNEYWVKFSAMEGTASLWQAIETVASPWIRAFSEYRLRY